MGQIDEQDLELIFEKIEEEEESERQKKLQKETKHSKKKIVKFVSPEI